MKLRKGVFFLFLLYTLLFILSLWYIIKSRGARAFEFKSHAIPPAGIVELKQKLNKVKNTSKKISNKILIIQPAEDPKIKKINKAYSKSRNITYVSVGKGYSPLLLVNDILYANDDHEIIIFFSPYMLVIDFRKDFDRILHQAGDSNLILGKNQAGGVSLDLIILRNNDWGKNKIGQIYNGGGSAPIILSPVINPAVNSSDPSNFSNFSQIEKGAPYFSFGICIYNGHAFGSPNSSFILDAREQEEVLSRASLKFDQTGRVEPKDLGSPTVVVYPWAPIPGFTEIERNLDKLPKPEDVKDDLQIPKRIFQTLKTNLYPSKWIEKTIEPNRKLNPEYQYFFFDDLDCRLFIKENFSRDVYRAFTSLIPGSFKADLWRYCVLYIYGGCYLDMRLVLIKTLDEIIDGHNFVSPRDLNHFGDALWQGVLFASPRNPIILKAIRRASQNINRPPSNLHSLEWTGPKCLGESFLNFTNQERIVLGSGRAGDIKYKILQFDSSLILDGSEPIIIHRRHKSLNFFLTKKGTNLWSQITGGICNYTALCENNLIFLKLNSSLINEN